MFKSQSATPFWHQANRKVEIDMYEEKRRLKKRKRKRKRGKCEEGGEKTGRQYSQRQSKD